MDGNSNHSHVLSVVFCSACLCFALSIRPGRSPKLDRNCVMETLNYSGVPGLSVIIVVPVVPFCGSGFVLIIFGLCFERITLREPCSCPPICSSFSSGKQWVCVDLWVTVGSRSMSLCLLIDGHGCFTIALDAAGYPRPRI